MSWFDLQRQLAQARGYMSHPAYQARWQDRPAWLAALAAPGGVETLESRLGLILPLSVRAFLADPELVCLTQAVCGNEITFCDYPFEDGPFTVLRGGHQWMCLAMHDHSGMLYAVDPVGGDDPPVEHGFMQEDEPPCLRFPSFTEFVRTLWDRPLW